MKLDKFLVYSMLADVIFVLMGTLSAVFSNQLRHYAKVLGAFLSFIPCVCGSLANGQICCDCITACCEFKRGEKHQVVTTTGETVDKYKG